MVSLWGSKKGDDHSDDEPQSSTENVSHGDEERHSNEHEEANERSSLLPPHERRSRPRGGYLDPDDPAVSPYNLWTVRFMRYLTVLFAVITFLWWVLLLTSVFVSPPGMHSRGSGFFDISYTSLTLGNLLVALIFFITPAGAIRIELAILSILLLVDIIIVTAVPHIRLEEGWVGVTSLLWAFLMTVWSLATDRIVAWGKKEEEERLTGRSESRRTLREWTAVLVATILQVVFIVIVVFMTATLIIRARDSTLELYGDRWNVDGDKYHVHLACVGNVTYRIDGKPNPTILLEAGEDPVEYDFEHWAYSSIRNNTISRYCYWDRPGYAWSDNAPSPHSAGMSATALAEALVKAGEQGPWIAVSAGYGSLVSRIFSSRNRKRVVGLLLIDPLHEDLLGRIGNPGRGFVLWGYGIISPLGFTRIAGALFKGRSREDRVYGRNAYQSGKYIKAQLQENLVAESLTRNDAVSARTIQDRNTPLVVISSGESIKNDREWEAKQEDMTKLTDNLLYWMVVNKAPHKIWKTWEGRRLMEKGLAQLMEESRRMPPMEAVVEG